MIGVDTGVGITHPNITKCEDCGGELQLVVIENHKISPYFFKCLECEDCETQFNIQPLNKVERESHFKELESHLRRERNKLNRMIATLKKGSQKCDMDLCDNCGGELYIPSNIREGGEVVCNECKHSQAV